MKFRWLGNSCVEIVGRKHILIDPNYLIDPQPAIDYILVTHEHSDHFDAEKVRKLSGQIVAPRSVLDEFGVDARIVEPGDILENIRVVESFCWKSRGSVGYLIEDRRRLLHLGDSTKFPEVKADVAFVPVFPEYHDEIASGVMQIGASLVIPIHYSDEKRRNAEMLGKKIEICKLIRPGEWMEL